MGTGGVFRRWPRHNRVLVKTQQFAPRDPAPATQARSGEKGADRSRAGLSLLAGVVSAFLGASSLNAGSTSAPMTVSVQVIGRAILSIESAPRQIEITADDVARGYVDLPGSIILRVRTNSRSGYLLQASNAGPAFISAELSFGDATMKVVEESWIQRPYASGGDRLSIHARLRLAPMTTAGAYTLPLAFSASVQ